MESDVIKYLIEIKTSVAGIEEHLKTLNGKVAKNISDIYDHECRIRSVSRWRYYIMGMIGGIMAVGSLLLKFL